MTISMYAAAIPVMSRALNNLAAILDKGAAHAEARKIDPLVLCASRLYPDMFALTKQVQIATDVAKGGAARLAGLDAPKFDDNEAGFPDLVSRVQKTVAYLATFKPAQIDGSEEKTIKLKIGGNTLTFAGMSYLLDFVLPNVYFHVATAYDILRHNGVELGKQDFLGKPS